jgi:hypothetical protein
MTKIDLHGLRHDEARLRLIRKVEGLWGTGESIEVIAGNSPKMKEIASQVLAEYGIECRQDDANNGVLRAEIHDGGTKGDGWERRP